MAASFVNGLVVKRNDTIFLDTDLVNYGVIQPLPTPGAGGDPTDGDFWAVPIVDEGVVDGFDFIPTSPTSTDAPSAQSFHVFRLITVPGRAQRNTWYAVGTTLQYIEAAADAECCAADPAELPTTIPPLAPEQKMCYWNNSTDKQYFAIFGTPEPGQIYAYGYFNDEALPDLSGSGYADADALVSAMNSLWGAAVGGTFTNDDGVITLTQSAGSGDDVIAVNIYSIQPSS